jgi:hypothetical protein
VWWDIAAVCPAGVCSGTLIGFDMDGWTFATVDAVNAVFNTYIAAAGGTAAGYPLSGPSTASEEDSTWAPQFLADFDPTDTFQQTQQVVGLTATAAGSINPFSVRAGTITDAGTGNDIADSSFSPYASVSSLFIGAWFVRDAPSGVPVPATVGLFSVGLAGLGWIRRRKA